MLRENPMPHAPVRPAKLRRSQAATGWLAVLFVWLSVLAPALHQHNRTAAVTVPAHINADAITNNTRDGLAANTARATADDFCSLCDYLTTATFAPPPAPIVCVWKEPGAFCASLPEILPSDPILSRALSRFSPRGPPVRA